MTKEQQITHILDVWASSIITDPSLTLENKAKAVEKIIRLFDEISIPLEERRTAFADTLRPYVDTYGSSMIKEFYAYWGSAKTQRSKMAFEQQKSWNLPARLSTWAKNQKKFSIANMVRTKGLTL